MSLRKELVKKMGKNNRICALGLDIGQRRIGIAGCDGTGLIATGLATLERRSFHYDVEQLKYWINQREAKVLVVGLPYTMNGQLGHQAGKVQTLANKFALAVELPLEYVDERLTSVEAEEQLKSQKGFSARHDKGKIDRVAAAIILQQWLDTKRKEKPKDDYFSI
jgi:putative Holliday junction resolvase